MEPVVFNLKTEQSSDLSCLPPHVMLGGEQQRSAPQTHKRLPKRTGSSQNFGFPDQFSFNNFTMETNYIPLMDQPRHHEWQRHEWEQHQFPHYNQQEQHFPFMNRIQNNQPSMIESFDAHPANSPRSWEDVDTSSASEMEASSGGKSEKSSYEQLPEVQNVTSITPAQVERALNNHRTQMESFPSEEVADFKHVIYNLLVAYHNNPTETHLVEPCTIVDADRARNGFRFNELCFPEKKLPELYVQHLKNAQLELENQSSPLIQDLYKFYMRSCVELLSKYFEKVDKYTYLYEDEENPLFVPNGTLLDAEVRIKNMKTRTRKKKAKKMNNKQPSLSLAQMSFLNQNAAQTINLRSTHTRKKPAIFEYKPHGNF